MKKKNFITIITILAILLLLGMMLAPFLMWHQLKNTNIARPPVQETEAVDNQETTSESNSYPSAMDNTQESLDSNSDIAIQEATNDADDAHGDTNNDTPESLHDEFDVKKEEGEPNDMYKEANLHTDTSFESERVIYSDGFFIEPLTQTTIDYISDVSFHENEHITFDDLRYLQVLYIGFDGETHVGELICNQAIAEDLIDIFTRLYENKYELEKVKLVDEYDADDDLSCADNNSSAFNYRVVAGTDRLSNHAKGLAIDINPFYNPYITYPNGIEHISPEGSDAYADRSNMQPHMIDENDLCYQLFMEHGFSWGGHWKSIKDYQHFEKPEAWAK